MHIEKVSEIEHLGLCWVLSSARLCFLYLEIEIHLNKLLG